MRRERHSEKEANNGKGSVISGKKVTRKNWAKENKLNRWRLNCKIVQE